MVVCIMLLCKVDYFLMIYREDAGFMIFFVLLLILEESLIM